MSYDSKVAEGVITISPPLTLTQLREHPELLKNNRHRYIQDAYVAVSESVVATDDGDLIKKAGHAIEIPDAGTPISRYNLEKDLQAIVDAFDGHEFPGYLELLDEDGDRWRLIVRNRVVVTISPVTSWPGPEDSSTTREAKISLRRRITALGIPDISPGRENLRLALATLEALVQLAESAVTADRLRADAADLRREAAALDTTEFTSRVLDTLGTAARTVNEEESGA